MPEHFAPRWQPIEGEPHFMLLARDIHAPGLVRAWADDCEDAIARGQRPETDRERVQNAHTIAREMEAWRKANADTAPWRAPMPLFENATERRAAAYNGEL